MKYFKNVIIFNQLSRSRMTSMKYSKTHLKVSAANDKAGYGKKVSNDVIKDHFMTIFNDSCSNTIVTKIEQFFTDSNN